MGEDLEPTVNLSPAVTLDAYGVHTTVESLSSFKDAAARILVARIRKEWRFRRSGQDYVTLRLTNNELELVRQAGGVTSPKLVSYNYVAIFRHAESGQEVTLRSIDRPPKKRAFRTPSHGRKRFKRVKLFRISQPKESAQVATKTKGKKKNPKASEDSDDEDELEGLEELEALEEEEPDDDEEDDEDEEEEKPKRKRKAKSGSKSSKKKAKKGKAKAKPKVEEEDDEDEDDDEEEEAPPKKSKSKKGKKGKKSSKGTTSPGTSTKEMTGGVGTAELAEAATELAEQEITGREVRVYLRKHEVEKNEEHGRYVWPSEKNKQFTKLAKAIAAYYEEDDDE